MTNQFPQLDEGGYLYGVPNEVFPSGIPFGSTTYNALKVHINGFITFAGEPGSGWEPQAMASLAVPVIAPYWADSDLSAAVGGVHICNDSSNGAISVTWMGVPSFDAATCGTSLTNSFQVVLSESTICSSLNNTRRLGIEFRYEKLDWYMGAFGSTGPNCAGTCVSGEPCTPAVAGWTNGTTNDQLAGSALQTVREDLLTASNIGVNGVYQWDLAGPSTSCGDGTLEPCEECDSPGGNSNAPNAACRTDCTNPGCGDGVVDDGEECDGGAGNSDTTSDACRVACVNPRCGDGVTDTGEGCDDGPSNSDTVVGACRTNCVAASCGDGVVDSGEECDNGAANNDGESNACRLACLNPSCGDGVVDSSEVCDDGASNDDELPGACRTTCIYDVPTAHGAGCLDIAADSRSGGAALLLLIVAVLCMRRRRLPAQREAR